MSPQPQSVAAPPASPPLIPTYPAAFTRFALIAIVLFLRRPDALTNPQPYAEDATIFLKDALEHPGPTALLRPYAGYFHLVPRLIAWAAVATAAPEDIPLFFNVAAIAIAAASIALFSSTRFRSLIASDSLRFAVCLLAAAAHPATEIVNTLTNVQWYLALAALLLLGMPMASPLAAIAAAVAQLVIALTSPLAACIAPLAAFFLLIRLHTHRAASAALLFGVAAHIALVATQIPAADRRPFHLNPGRIALHGLDRMYAASAYAGYGYPLADWLNRRLAQSAPLSAAAATLAIASLLALTSRRVLAAVILAALVSWLCSAAHVAAAAADDPLPSRMFFGVSAPAAGRLLFFPYCVALFWLAAAWDAARTARCPILARLGGFVFIFAAAANLTGALRPSPFANFDWRSRIRAARAAAWHAEIPVNPPGWTLSLRGLPREPL